ncbi:hypothetical protein Tco_0231729 [Tanacetum coccineum]
MVNIFPPDHVNDLPEVKPNQPESALVNENEEPEEEEEFEDKEEFKEEEPQEEEDDMEVDIEEEDNEPKLIFPYVEADPLNPPLPAPDSESKDVVKVKDMVKPKDENVPNSVHKVEDIIKDFGDAEERAECKKLKKELEEARSSNTLLCMHKERVERDFYWTRVQAHEFYQEMISRGVVFEERPNKAIDVLIKDEDSPSSKP